MTPGHVTVGAGVDTKGDAAITLEMEGVCIVLDIYKAMQLIDLIDRKLGQAINWHKLVHDPDTPAVFAMEAAGTA